MKKLLSILIVLIQPLFLYSQNTAYLPLLEKGKKSFSIDVCTSAQICSDKAIICGGERSLGHYYVISEKDTLIKSNKYYQLCYYTTYSNDKQCSDAPYYMDTTHLYTSNYLLREDTIKRQVLMFNVDSAKEYVLYDFGLKKGDTLKNYYYAYQASIAYYVVDSVKNVQINGGELRKQWFFHSEKNPASFVIEGIGNPEGILRQVLPAYLESRYTYGCLSKNGLSMYGNTCPIAAGPQSVGIQEQEKNILIDVYPNPVSDILNIHTTDPLAFKETSLRIYNALGQEVYQQKGMDNINTALLENGMYWVVITTAGRRVLTQQFQKL